MIVFKSAPEYTTAHDYSRGDCVALDEWCGQPHELFHAAMIKNGGRLTDTRRYEISGREIVEYVYS